MKNTSFVVGGLLLACTLRPAASLPAGSALLLPGGAQACALRDFMCAAQSLRGECENMSRARLCRNAPMKRRRHLSTTRTRRGSNVRRLGRLDCTSSVHDSKKIRLAPCTTAAALKLGSLLDCKRHMVDITLDLRRGLEGDCLPTDDAGHCTSDDHLLTCDHSSYFALLTDYNFSGHHVALDLAVYLKDATADDLQPLADDLEVVPDDGFLTS